MFFVIPLLVLGISQCFAKQRLGYSVLGSFLIFLLTLGFSWTMYYCHCLNGRERCLHYVQQRERRSAAVQRLPDDMERLQRQVATLMAHAGLGLQHQRNQGYGGGSVDDDSDNDEYDHEQEMMKLMLHQRSETALANETHGFAANELPPHRDWHS